MNFDRARSWEPAVCYYVDDAGRYDVMSAHDFSELLHIPRERPSVSCASCEESARRPRCADAAQSIPIIAALT